MKIQKVFIGGWFQRTTLHLTEIWGFLKEDVLAPGLDVAHAKELRSRLELEHFTREAGSLECIVLETAHDISCRLYEDGLILLEKKHDKLGADADAVREYYENKLSPALSYLFSLGAPLPKELADIKNIYPFIVTTQHATHADITDIFGQRNETIHSTTQAGDVSVYHANGLILINNVDDESVVRSIIESQIFFREFKGQLHRYLHLHRSLWGKIEHIKEMGTIRGTEVETMRHELTAYQKTVTLISSRLNQMSSYIKTRQKIATDTENLNPELKTLFQFKFETLLDTHDYVKHIWDLTKNYLGSALEVFNDLQNKSTKTSLSSLQLITTVGVVAGLVGHVSRDTFPKLTQTGALYLCGLLVLTYLVNMTVSQMYKRKKYKVEANDMIRTKMD